MRNRVEVCVTPPPAASRDAITMLGQFVAIAAAVAARHGEGGSDADDGDPDGDTADALRGRCCQRRWPARRARRRARAVMLHPLLQWSAAAAQRLRRGSSLADALREACGGVRRGGAGGARSDPTILERCVGASADEATLAARALSLVMMTAGGVRAVALRPAPASAVGLFSDSVAATVRPYAALTVSLAALVARGGVDGDAAPLLPAADFEGLAAAAFLFAEKASVDDHTLRRALLLRVAASRRRRRARRRAAAARPHARGGTHPAVRGARSPPHGAREAAWRCRVSHARDSLRRRADRPPPPQPRSVRARAPRRAESRALAPPSRDGAVQTDADGTAWAHRCVGRGRGWAVASLEVGSQPASSHRRGCQGLAELRLPAAAAHLRDEMYASIEEKARLEATLAALPPNSCRRSTGRTRPADGVVTHPPIEPAADVQAELPTAKQFGEVESRSTRCSSRFGRRSSGYSSCRAAGGVRSRLRHVRH